MIDKLLIIIIALLLCFMYFHTIYLLEEIDMCKEESVTLYADIAELTVKVEELKSRLEITKEVISVYESYDWEKITWVWRNKDLFE